MPTYGYICQDCEEDFEIKATIEEKEKGLKVNCPTCGSNRVVQVFGGIALFSRGSRGGSFSSTPGCGPICGLGCC